MTQLLMSFDGATYEPELDQERLTGAYKRIFNLMKDGQWYDLKTLAQVGRCTEAAASARIRDFRKERNGGHTVKRERIESSGKFVYQLIIRKP